MQAVSQGLSHRAERIFGAFPAASQRLRTPDVLRDRKKDCIVLNTLLRKSAESSGVHSVHLEHLEVVYDEKIEQLRSPSAAQALMQEMIRSYCRLVRNHAAEAYSPAVWRTIFYIESDLSRDLSLSILAKMQNINSSYLSSLFRRETGQTITTYIARRRVELAKQLLHSTDLQIQMIAQHCGISDVNYFSRLFKKHTGKTPREYREASKSTHRIAKSCRS